MKFYAVTLLVAFSVMTIAVVTVGGQASAGNGGAAAEVPPPAVRENDEVQRILPPSQLSLPCADYQGECMEHCNALGLRRPANDCQEGEHCCVLTV